MTRKPTSNYSLGVVVPFGAILTLLIAAAVLAQTTGAGRTSGKAHKLVVAPGERITAGGLQTKNVRRAMDPEYPLSFVPAVLYDSGGPDASGFSIAIADVNGDGKLDLVVAVADFLPQGATGVVSVLLGNGDGTFRAATTYGSGGAFAISVAVADLNGDGKPDIVVANCALTAYNYCWNGSSGVGVLLGNGDGTFQPVVTYDSGDAADSVAVGDLNGDGKPDLVIGSSLGAEARVLLGNGDGTFQPAVAYYAGSNGAAVALADVNGDGRVDLVVANYGSNTVSVLLGNGDGTFQQALSYGSGGYGTDAVAVADVNGDGKPDLVVANYGDGSVGVLLGRGDGTFQPAVTYSSGGSLPTSIAVSDVNGDGKPDLLVANYGSNVVAALLGNGDGTFQPAVTYNSCGGCTVWEGPASVAVADLNGDGQPDLVLSNPGNSANVSVLLNNSGAPPTTTTLISSLNPAPIRTPVTYTATVTSQNGGAVTGWVTFENGGSAMATVKLANHRAAYSTTYTDGGIRKITATYSGDAYDRGSTSATLMEDIVGVVSETVVTTSGSPSFVGQAVTFTATVTPSQGTIPDGELVTFYDNTIAIGTSVTSSGIATFVTSSLAAKTHIIKAAYRGDAKFDPSAGSVKQVVDKYTTTTALSSSLNPSNYGQPVTLTATVTSAGSAPTGTVTFKTGSVVLGSRTLNAGGVATLTTAKIPVGTDSLTATYNGDTFNGKSASAAVTQTVSQASISMVLTSTPNPSTFGKSVKFTARLTSNGGLPSGQPVTFSDNGATMGTANFSSYGVATFFTTTLPQGSDVVTAAYAGSVDYSSAAATVTQVVY